MPRRVAALLLALAPSMAPSMASTSTVDTFVPRLDASHLDLARVRGAVESGFASRVLLSELPLDGNVAAVALRAAGTELIRIPDADGLRSVRSLRHAAPYADASEPPVLIADPWRIEARGADLFFGERGVNPYVDGDWLEEGVHARARGAVGSPLTDWLDVTVGGRLEIGRTGTRGRFLHAAVVARARGMEWVAGRQSRWWGPGTLTDVLLTNNAMPLDGVSFGSDGYRGLGSLGAFSARVFLGYLNDGDRFRPYPLLFGHRTVWQPTSWIEFGAGRTIMLGGGGRTQKLKLDVLWDIFRGEGENRRGFSGPSDTDQKAEFDVQVYLFPLASTIPLLTGGRLFYQYGGDDSFEGFLPTTVAHHYGGSLQFPHTRLELELFENVAFGLFYWNDEYPSGYRNDGLFMGSDLGHDSRTGRGRITRSLGSNWGVRLELQRDSRGHRFREGDDLRPERKRLKTVAWEGGARLTRAIGRARASVSYHYRDVDGFSFDDDRTRARHVVRVSMSTP